MSRGNNMDNSNNPKPQQQPQAPQTPAPAPQGPQMQGSPYQMPQPKSNKKLFIWIGIGVGVLAIIGIVVAIVISLTSVSKDDYNKAYSQMSDLSSANTSLYTEISTLQYNVSYATETKFNNDIKAAEEALEKVRSENEELSEMKAVKVGEGKKKYDELTKNLTSI